MGLVSKVLRALSPQPEEAPFPGTVVEPSIREDQVVVTGTMWTPQDGEKPVWVADVWHPLRGHVERIKLERSPIGGRDVTVAAARAKGWRRAEAYSFKAHGPKPVFEGKEPEPNA